MLNNAAFWGVIFFLVSLASTFGGWHSPPAEWGCLIATAVLVIYALVAWLRLPQSYRWSQGAVRSLTIGGKVALSDAARIAYEEARAHDSLWAHAAERLAVDKSSDGILDYMAGYFAGDHQLYGRRMPSTRLEAIDRFQANQGAFRGGANRLYLRDQAKTIFSDLQVAKKDLKTVRKVMRESLKPTTPI